MADKEIEILAEELNWWGDTWPYVDWHIEGNDEVKTARRLQAGDILELLRQELPISSH